MRLHGPRPALTRSAASLAVLVVVALTVTVPSGSAVAAGDRQIRVTKATGLRGGETVAVSWSGFTPGPAYVLQCNDPDASVVRCDNQNVVVASTGPDGTGSARLTLRIGGLLDWQGYASPTLLCGKHLPCSVAVSECEFDRAASRLARARLEFDEVLQEDPETYEPVTTPAPRGPDDAPPPDPPPVAPPPSDRPEIRGMGSSDEMLVVDAWQNDVAFAPISPIRVTYTSINSPSGLESFARGSTDFAISALLPSVEQIFEMRSRGRSFAVVPITVNALAFVAGRSRPDAERRDMVRVHDFGMTPELAATMFSTRGSSINPVQSDIYVRAARGCHFADAGSVAWIGPTYRQDQSAANYLLTSWMRAVDDGSDPSDDIPIGTTLPVLDSTYQGRLGASDYAMFLSDQHGLNRPLAFRIGYIDLTFAQRYRLAVAQLGNSPSQQVMPTEQSVAKALAAGTTTRDGIFTPDFKAGSGAYPLTYVTYAIVPTSLSASFTVEEARVLRDFLSYAVSSAGQKRATELGTFSLTPQLADAARAAIAKIPLSGAAAGGAGGGGAGSVIDAAVLSGGTFPLATGAAAGPGVDGQGDDEDGLGDDQGDDDSTAAVIRSAGRVPAAALTPAGLTLALFGALTAAAGFLMKRSGQRPSAKTAAPTGRLPTMPRDARTGKRGRSRD